MVQSDMQRVMIIGCPGSGKSTFARALQPLVDLPLFYLDMIYHRHDHTTVSEDEFDRRLARIVAMNSWIIDGNYMRTLSTRLFRADTVFYLDLPTQICLDGIQQREGSKRIDMPWPFDEAEDGFIDYVRSFRAIQTPQIDALVNQYSDYYTLIRFTDRDQINAYLRQLQQLKKL